MVRIKWFMAFINIAGRPAIFLYRNSVSLQEELLLNSLTPLIFRYFCLWTNTKSSKSKLQPRLKHGGWIILTSCSYQWRAQGSVSGSRVCKKKQKKPLSLLTLKRGKLWAVRKCGVSKARDWGLTPSCFRKRLQSALYGGILHLLCVCSFEWMS